MNLTSRCEHRPRCIATAAAIAIAGLGGALPASAATYSRAGWMARLSTLFHNVDGVVTIVDETTLRIDDFSYDGTAPAVYVYLGASDTQTDFLNGVGCLPQLTRPYNHETLIVTLPPGETLDDYNAVSVWCAAVNVNFGSGTFFLPGDADGDGDVDWDDHADFTDCAAGPDATPAPSGLTPPQCLDIFDVDDDLDVDLRDQARFQLVYTVPPSTADFTLEFDATWSAATHPTDYPTGSSHFSGLIGGTHTAAVSFWDVGAIASDGIESMAETGSRTTLRNEIDAAILAGTADQAILGPGVSVSPGMASLNFTASQDYPLFTMVTMIAPSPDWFVGVSGVPLFQNGQWIDEVVIPLAPYDSGTDSGVTYSSPNADITPHIPIIEITGFPLEHNGSVAPLGTFTIRRLP